MTTRLPDVTLGHAVVARRIDHVAIAVRDADEAIERFRSSFGLVVSADSPSGDDLVRLVYLEAGDTTLQIVQPLRPGPVLDWLDANGEGIHHICFDVPDLEGSLRALPNEADVVVGMGGRGCRVAFIKARPHGVIVELTETPTSPRI